MSLSLSLYIYIYIHICNYNHIYIRSPGRLPGQAQRLVGLAGVERGLVRDLRGGNVSIVLCGSKDFGGSGGA